MAVANASIEEGWPLPVIFTRRFVSHCLADASSKVLTIDIKVCAVQAS